MPRKEERRSITVVTVVDVYPYIFKVSTFRPLPRPEGRKDAGGGGWPRRGGGEGRGNSESTRERGEGDLGLSPLRKREGEGGREGGWA